MFFKITKDKINEKKGFTLIEIAIVLVIIAILAAILVPNLLKWVDKSKDTKMLSAAKTVKDCVVAEFADMHKNGEELGADETAYDEDFWSAVSDAAGTTVTNDSKKNGYVQFTVENDTLKTFSYTKDDRIATLNENGSFDITTNANPVKDKESTATTNKSDSKQPESTNKSDSKRPESTKKPTEKQPESTSKSDQKPPESTKKPTKEQTTETTTKKDQQGSGESSWWDRFFEELEKFWKN